jgi:hypothetical protein
MATVGEIASVNVDGNIITGKVYNVRDNGWPCIEIDEGRIASGPQEGPSTLDFDARYTVDGYRGIAFWLKGYATHIVEYGDGFEEEETDYSFVKAVMVGDNREHIIDVDDLTLLDENDYCHVCGQVGCQHDGLDRD